MPGAPSGAAQPGKDAPRPGLPPLAIDFALLRKNVEGLSLCAGEGQSTVVTGPGGERRFVGVESLELVVYSDGTLSTCRSLHLQPPHAHPLAIASRQGITCLRHAHVDSMSLSLDAGFTLAGGPFRSASSESGRAFLQDLLDNYFPYELKERYPEGGARERGGTRGIGGCVACEKQRVSAALCDELRLLLSEFRRKKTSLTARALLGAPLIPQFPSRWWTEAG